MTGVTGYIGGSVLVRLLEPSRKSKYEIRALVRSEEAVEKLKQLGVVPVLGSLDDLELLEKEATNADVVLNTANADHLPGTKAMVKGLSEKSKRRILIHTSGTGVLCDGAKGDYKSDFIYNDTDMDSVHAIPISALHKDVDSFIFENVDHFNSVIICPPTIYGLGIGPFNKHSVQIPMWIRAYSKVGHVATVGKGENYWNDVHIEDLADFYVLVLEKALAGEVEFGKNGWYFCESGEHRLGDVVAKIAEAMNKYGGFKDSSVRPFLKEEVDSLLGDIGGWLTTGGNSRCKSDKARALGWVAKNNFGTILESIDPEVKTILKK